MAMLSVLGLMLFGSIYKEASAINIDGQFFEKGQPKFS